MINRLVQCSLLALALAGATQAKAGATIYGTYYDETITNFCSNDSSCRLYFAQLPADKLLMVSKINCKFVTSAPLTAIAALNLYIATGPNGAGQLGNRYLPITIPAPQISGTTYTWSLREETHYLIGQGRYPYVSFGGFNASSSIDARCTLVGDLVTPIQ